MAHSSASSSRFHCRRTSARWIYAQHTIRIKAIQASVIPRKLPARPPVPPRAASMRERRILPSSQIGMVNQCPLPLSRGCRLSSALDSGHNISKGIIASDLAYQADARATIFCAENGEGILTKCQGRQAVPWSSPVRKARSAAISPSRLFHSGHAYDGDTPISEISLAEFCRGPQCSFCIVQPAFHARVWRIHIQGPGISQAQTGPQANHLVWELL